MFKRNNLIIAMSLAPLILSGQDTCERVIADLNSGLETRSVNDSGEYAARAEASHRNDTPTCYAAVCSRLAEFFAARARGNELMRRFEQHYAEAGLSVADSIPVAMEIVLVMRLRPDESVTSGDHRLRWRRAALWAHAWQRIEAETISGFNFEDRPYFNMSLPRGVSGVAGMSPEGIQDLRARAQYENSIQENREKAERFNTQVMLRRITPRFVDDLEWFFVKSFSTNEAGQVVGLFSSVRSTDKERIIKHIAETPNTDQ